MFSDTILVTGGAGFIGCNFVRAWLKSEKGTVVNLDKLTYAAAKVSGILANDTCPAEFIYENLGIHANVVHESYCARGSKACCSWVRPASICGTASSRSGKSTC